MTDARRDLELSFHFILRVTSKGRDSLSEQDFDKMAELFMAKLDAYIADLGPAKAQGAATATCTESDHASSQ